MSEDNKSIELRSKFETINFDTGELINVVDSSLPVRSRVDTAKWLIDRFNAEIEMCKVRKDLWNDREDIFKIGIEKIRECIKSDMQAEGIENIKTIENTVFLTAKDITSFDESKVPDEFKIYDITIKSADKEKLDELIGLAMEYDMEYTYKSRIEPWMLPAELVRKDKAYSITFRKSPKSH